LFRTWVPVFRGRTAEERVEAARQVFAVLEMVEQAFKEYSKGKPFFGGDNVGLVDVVLGGHLGCLYATEAICGVKALLVAWAERFCVLDAVKGLIPDVERLVEYNQVRRAGLGLPLLLHI
jgi:glutathione S-transferase